VPPDPRVTLGKTIRRIRQKKGISQEKLAELCDLHRTYISGIERGERNVSLLNIVEVARALGVRSRELLRDID
jgi:transcriptional regulator with XRE-family HTH domain